MKHVAEHGLHPSAKFWPWFNGAWGKNSRSKHLKTAFKVAGCKLPVRLRMDRNARVIELCMYVCVL